MRKTKIAIFILIILSIILIPLTVKAAQINPDAYYSSGPSASDVKDMYKYGGRVIGMIQIIGTIVSAGTLIIIGIRYVIASADEKAEYKERMVPYVVGAVLLFGGSNIVNVGYKFIDGLRGPVATVSPTTPKTDSDGTTSTITFANFEFNNCLSCGKELTDEENKADKCSCGSLIGFADRTSTHCGYCGSDNVVLVSTVGLIYKNGGQDLYCYNCDLWNNYSAREEIEVKLADASEEAKNIVEEERNKAPSERNGIRD